MNSERKKQNQNQKQKSNRIESRKIIQRGATHKSHYFGFGLYNLNLKNQWSEGDGCWRGWNEMFEHSSKILLPSSLLLLLLLLQLQLPFSDHVSDAEFWQESGPAQAGSFISSFISFLIDFCSRTKQWTNQWRAPNLICHKETIKETKWK